MGTVGAFWKGTGEPAQPACSRSPEGVSAADTRYWLPESDLNQNLYFFWRNQLESKICAADRRLLDRQLPPPGGNQEFSTAKAMKKPGGGRAFILNKQNFSTGY